MLCTCVGADVNSEVKDGATALYEACRNNHSDIVELLLSQSADANRAGKDGLLPLHVAAKHGNNRCAQCGDLLLTEKVINYFYLLRLFKNIYSLAATFTSSGLSPN